MPNSLLTQPWGTTPEYLAELLALADRNPDIDAVLTKRGKAMANTQTVEVRGQTAIIPISGPIFKSESIFSWMFDATTVESLAQEFTAAIEDPSVNHVVLDIHSPGGQVFGVGELSNIIYAARGKKQITAYVSGMAASAAYWIASAADEVVMDASAMAGSLGVVFTYSQKNSTDIEIVSTLSPLKRVDPSTDEGRAQILRQADAIANVFIDAVARNRGMARERVITDFGRGGMLVGQEAVNAGLADSLGSLEQIITRNIYLTGGVKMPIDKQTAEHFPAISTIEQLSATYPNLAVALRDQGAAGVDTAKISKEARESEAARILALASVQFGEEAGKRLGAIVQTGVTLEQFRAITEATPKADAPKQPDAETELAALKAKGLEAIQNAGAQNPGHQSSNASNGDFMAMVKEYHKAHNCSYVEASKAIVHKHPEAHAAYLAKAQMN